MAGWCYLVPRSEFLCPIGTVIPSAAVALLSYRIVTCPCMISTLNLHLASYCSESLCCSPPLCSGQRQPATVLTLEPANSIYRCFMQVPLVEVWVANGVHGPCVKAILCRISSQSDCSPAQELMVPVSTRHFAGASSSDCPLSNYLKNLQAWSSHATSFPPLSHESSAKNEWTSVGRAQLQTLDEGHAA